VSIVASIPRNLSVRAICTLVQLSNGNVADKIVENLLPRASDGDQVYQTQRLWRGMDYGHVGKRNWKPNLGEISDAYQKGGMLTDMQTYHRIRHKRASTIPKEIAIPVLSSPLSFPGALVQLIEVGYSQSLSKVATPVSRIAEQQKWFVNN